MVSCGEQEARRAAVKAAFPCVSFIPEEEQVLGAILIEISIRETRLKQLGQDLREVAEVLGYAGSNCCRNPKERAALKRIMEFAKVSRQPIEGTTKCQDSK